MKSTSAEPTRRRGPSSRWRSCGRLLSAGTATGWLLTGRRTTGLETRPTSPPPGSAEPFGGFPALIPAAPVRLLQGATTLRLTSGLSSARAEGVSIRKLAAAAALSPARVHQITAAADLDELDTALEKLRAAGWPASEDPDADDDAELDGRDLICDRLVYEVGWIRQCADWLTHLRTSQYPGGQPAPRRRSPR